jgi:chemotaxis protein histidine kinase CheA
MPAPTFEIEAPAPARAATSSPLPHIDPLLYDIFTSEVAAHLGVIDAFVAEAQAAYQPLPASEPLLRAVHTLNGAVAMVDVPVITQVLAPLENYIKRLCAGHLAPTPDGLMVLSEASELIRRVLAALDRETHLPNADDLAQRIGMLRDTLPEPQQFMHTLFARGDAAHETAEAAPVVDTPSRALRSNPHRRNRPRCSSPNSWQRSPWKKRRSSQKSRHRVPIGSTRCCLRKRRPPNPSFTSAPISRRRRVLPRTTKRPFCPATNLRWRRQRTMRRLL